MVILKNNIYSHIPIGGYINNAAGNAALENAALDKVAVGYSMGFECSSTHLTETVKTFTLDEIITIINSCKVAEFEEWSLSSNTTYEFLKKKELIAKFTK